MPKITQEYMVYVSGKQAGCSLSLAFDFHQNDFRILDGRWDMDGSTTESFDDAYDIFEKTEKILKNSGWDCFEGEVCILQTDVEEILVDPETCIVAKRDLTTVC